MTGPQLYGERVATYLACAVGFALGLGGGLAIVWRIIE